MKPWKKLSKETCFSKFKDLCSLLPWLPKMAQNWKFILEIVSQDTSVYQSVGLFVPDCAMTNDWQKKWSDSKVSSDSSNCAKTYRRASFRFFTISRVGRDLQVGPLLVRVLIIFWLLLGWFLYFFQIIQWQTTSWRGGLTCRSHPTRRIVQKRITSDAFRFVFT